jgi:hypothetical protein
VSIPLGGSVLSKSNILWTDIKSRVITVPSHMPRHRELEEDTNNMTTSYASSWEPARIQILPSFGEVGVVV